MTKSQPRSSYVFDKDLVDRDEAALVCAVILDVLRADLKAAHVDAYSDYESEMPDRVRVAEAALRELGATQHPRDPSMGIELDLIDATHASLLDIYAPWSINVDLFGLGHKHVGTFHDCATSIHFRAHPQQAVEIGGRLTPVGALISQTVHDERRRRERWARWAARRKSLIRCFGGTAQ